MLCVGKLKFVLSISLVFGIVGNTQFCLSVHSNILSQKVGISLSYAGKLKDLAFDLDPQT